jgi:hypothetical protein
MNTINNHGIELSVTVNGRPTRTYFHEGKYFIESRDGTEYAIKIRNTNWFRVETVIAVDGLSVINGKPASKQDIGYVLDPYQEYTIKGYRKNDEEVGAFKFTKKSKSYAARKGESDNVGVIAVAVYKEKTKPLPIYTGNSNWAVNNDVWRDNIVTTTGTPVFLNQVSDSSGITTGSSSQSVTSNSKTYATCTADITLNASLTNASKGCNNVLRSVEETPFAHGTTWGKKIEDKVTHTIFERDYVIFGAEIYYNSKENLESMGIKIVPEKKINFPRGFPRDYAEPPAGWNG